MLLNERERKWPMTRWAISSKLFQKYTGIISSPHRFRHTAATNLMKKPENLYIAKQLLGHKDVKVTLSYIEDNIDSIREYTELL